jgi:ABC-type nitrate/sulfonate/bicarbonate transport system substrate-binding protein
MLKLLAGLLLLLAIGPLVVAPAAAAPVQVEFGITSLTAFSLPHYIAAAKNFYADENLAVDTVVGGAAAGVIRELAGGSLDIGQAATNQTLRAIVAGAPVKIVAGAAANAPFRLIVAKSIKSWSDLKGRIVTVGGATDVTLYFLRTMAHHNGLADSDYDVVYAGGSPDRFAQLLSGAVAGAMLTNPLDVRAVAQGFVELGRVPDYLPHWAQNNLMVNTAWAAGHRAAVVAFLRVHIRATDYLYDPKNRDEVIRILAASTKSSPEVAASTYDAFIRDEVIAPKGALFEPGIQANLDALVAMGELKSAPPLGSLIDPSFLGEATSGATRPEGRTR